MAFIKEELERIISVIAVGFKVNSERAVQFRKWVNQIASEYTIKGWVMDDERLKRGTYLTDKYRIVQDRIFMSDFDKYMLEFGNEEILD